MGWASGTRVAEELWELIRPLTNESNRQEYALRLIEIFEDADCDNLNECELLTEDSAPNHLCHRCGGDSCGCENLYGSDDLEWGD